MIHLPTVLGAITVSLFVDGRERREEPVPPGQTNTPNVPRATPETPPGMVLCRALTAFHQTTAISGPRRSSTA